MIITFVLIYRRKPAKHSANILNSQSWLYTHKYTKEKKRKKDKEKERWQTTAKNISPRPKFFDPGLPLHARSDPWPSITSHKHDSFRAVKSKVFSLSLKNKTFRSVSVALLAQVTDMIKVCGGFLSTEQWHHRLLSLCGSKLLRERFRTSSDSGLYFMIGICLLSCLSVYLSASVSQFTSTCLSQLSILY